MISVIVPTHLDCNDKYLQCTLRALNEQDADMEVIVVSDRKTSPDISIVKNHPCKLVEAPKGMRFAAKNNLGIKLADNRSTHYHLISDDVMPTRGMVKDMAAMMHAGIPAIMASLSNCDVGPLYFSNFAMKMDDGGYVSIPPAFTYEQAESFLPKLFEYNPYRGNGFIFEVPRLYFYNVMIPKSVYEKVGPLDENFLNSCDDYDYCIRAKRAGVRLYVQQNTFCIHFGGKTSALTATSEERIADQKYIEEKHGPYYSIVT